MESKINLPRNSIETQFLFFYNIGAQISDSAISEKAKNTQSNNFEFREISGSELYTSAFFNNPIPIICALHFHAKDPLVNDIKNDLLKEGTIEFADLPCTFYKEPRKLLLSSDSDEIKEKNFHDRVQGEKENANKNLGFSFLEFTLFKNGILAVILRLTNKTDLTDSDYVNLITKSKQIKMTEDLTCPITKSDSMMILAGKIMKAIEDPLVDYLNQLEIEGISSITGEEKKITFHCTNFNKAEGRYETNIISFLEKEEKLNSFNFYNDGKDVFHTCFITTTPYIGTVIDLSKRDCSLFSENKTTTRVHREREMQLALACARTTKEFLENFNDPELYLERELPRRNLYHPGPSIVFVGRRGWACIVRENREPTSFQLHVIEIVLLVITSILASTIYTRDFIKKITEEGDEIGKKFLLKLQGKEPIDNGLILDYTNFVSRIKLGLPQLNLGVLLSSHISAHTGIAAIRRLKYLTKHDELILSANDLVENYNSFFTSIDQYWKSKQLCSQTEALELTKRNVKAAVYGVAVTAVGAIATAVGVLSATRMRDILDVLPVVCALAVLLLLAFGIIKQLFFCK